MKKALKLVGTLIVFTQLFACAEAPNEGSQLSLQENSSQGAVNNRLVGIEDKVKKLLSQLTLEEKVSLVHANAKFSIPAVQRLGIHEMWMSDGPHTVRKEIERHTWSAAGWEDDYSTYLPPLTAVAASWNPDIATLHGNVLGSEARHRRKDLILGPGVNMARLPLNGRNFEYMGEDPYLAARLAVAKVKAIQKNDVAATVKHYALNTQEQGLLQQSFSRRPGVRPYCVGPTVCFYPSCQCGVEPAKFFSPYHRERPRGFFLA